MAERDFIERYNRVPVPESLRTIDMAGDMSADDRSVLERVDSFFEEVAGAFSFTDIARASLLEVNHRMLVPLDGSLRATDDQIDELWIRNIQPLATVLRTRDEWNWQVAQFSKYPLLPRTACLVQSALEASAALDAVLKDSFFPPRDSSQS